MDNSEKNPNRAIGNYDDTQIPWYLEGRILRKSPKERDVFKVKHCTNCGKCWEYERYDTSRILKYDDFPAYNCAKETCIDCL